MKSQKEVHSPMSIKENCAFLKIRTGRGGKQSCIALKQMICKEKECPFFKTFEQERDELYKTGMNRKGRKEK